MNRILELLEEGVVSVANATSIVQQRLCSEIFWSIHH